MKRIILSIIQPVGLGLEYQFKLDRIPCSENINLSTILHMESTNMICIKFDKSIDFDASLISFPACVGNFWTLVFKVNRDCELVLGWQSLIQDSCR